METDDRNILSNLFFTTAVNDFNIKTQTLEWFNEAFGMKMRNGIFRVFTLRFDFSRQSLINEQGINSIQKKSMEIIKTSLSGICFDLLLTRNVFFCRSLLNYLPERESELLNALESSLEEIKKIPELAAAGMATLGLSLPYKEIMHTQKALKEVKEAIWLRFSKGKGKIIEWEKEQPLSESNLKTMDYYKRKFKATCLQLDRDEFLRTSKDFMALPKRFLLSKETRTLLYDIEQFMYEANRDLISEFSDIALIHKNIRNALKQAATLEEYFESYFLHISSLFEQINQCSSKNSKLIKQIKSIVKQEITKDVRLGDVAYQTGLNEVYISHLFKKETGINFTDYVLRCKIDVAKQHLVNNKIKIDTIATLAGFSNSKYFSKKFKEAEGISPSEYRRFRSLNSTPLQTI
jgi:two-component system response regulator YesN